MTQFNDAFWRWFGDSKVVDGKGNPLVVYHGTGEAGISVFKTGTGAWFSTDSDLAAAYSGSRSWEGGAPTLYSVYLRMTRPLKINAESRLKTTREELAAAVGFAWSRSKKIDRTTGWPVDWRYVKVFQFVHTPEFVRAAANEGYDGIIMPEGRALTFGVFSPTQIKSATGNDGSWDSDDPDITSNPQEAGNPNRDFLQQPTYEDMGRALDVSKRPYIGAHLSLPDGYPVGLRIDIPAFERHGIYVITVHEKASRGAVGKRIGYGSAARILNPVFFSVKSGAAKIAGGHAKFPVATVEGLYINDTSTPEDIDEWTPVGYNPRKALFFYEKDVDSSGRVSVGREVMSGDEAILVGNTVFVKSAVFSPTQIKSATGNDGTWDRDDPDITSNPPVRFAKKWVAGYCGDFMEILSDALASRGIQARRKGVLASDGRVHHVVLQIGDKLIDARGVLTKEELFAELAAQGGALQPTALVPLTEAHLSGFKCASEEDLDALSEEIELWVENDLLREL